MPLDIKDTCQAYRLIRMREVEIEHYKVADDPENVICRLRGPHDRCTFDAVRGAPLHDAVLGEIMARIGAIEDDLNMLGIEFESFDPSTL